MLEEALPDILPEEPFDLDPVMLLGAVLFVLLLGVVLELSDLSSVLSSILLSSELLTEDD